MVNKRYMLAVFLLILVVLLNLPVPAAWKVKAFGRDNVAPFQNLMSLVIARLWDGCVSIATVGRAMEERNDLRRENAELKVENRNLQVLVLENKRLRDQLAYKSRQKMRLVAAEVVSRGDASGWWQTITINKGISEGVHPGRAVVTTEGVVGKTVAVYQHSADILLITDPSCKIASTVVRSSSFGILRGMGSVPMVQSRVEFLTQPMPCRMDYVPMADKVVPGDEVVTSGLGGVFPEGFPVGHVVDAGVDPSGLFQRVDVVPAAELSDLRYVFVVGE